MGRTEEKLPVLKWAVRKMGGGGDSAPEALSYDDPDSVTETKPKLKGLPVPQKHLPRKVFPESAQVPM